MMCGLESFFHLFPLLILAGMSIVWILWDFAPLKCKILWHRDILNHIQTLGVLASNSFVKCGCRSSALHYMFWIWLSPMTIYSEGVFSNKSWAKRFIFSHWLKKAKPFDVVVLSSVVYLKNLQIVFKGRSLLSSASTGSIAEGGRTLKRKSLA